MEKLGILDDAEKWKEVRELRNAISHEYEDDPDELTQVLERLVESAPFLVSVHDRLQAFVHQAYAPVSPVSGKTTPPDCAM